MIFSARCYLLISSISGLLSITLGAFGAHGLKKVINPEMLAAYQTGVQYQFIHTLVVLALAVLLLLPSIRLAKSSVARHLKWAANLMLLGILLFSGSLYAMTFMSVTGGFPTWLGPITPIGGLAFIMGWIFLMVAAFKLPIDEQ